MPIAEVGPKSDEACGDALAMADPEVVAVPGWSHPGAFAALLWCLRNGRPAVLMSESGIQDDVRRRAREATKRRVVRLFSGAVVGGAPHRGVRP